MNSNGAKVISANYQGIEVVYTDTYKTYSLYYGGKTRREERKSSYQKICSTKQKELFNQVMYGLKNYTNEELDKIGYYEKLRIKRIFEQSQNILNIWKQEEAHKKLGSFLITAFHKSEFAKDLATYDKAINPKERCIFTFRDLKIRREQVIDKLINAGMLPENFYQIV